MSGTTDYSDILKRTKADIPQQKNLPRGTWLLHCTNGSYQPAKGPDSKPMVTFVYEAKQAMDDVNPDEITALGEDYDISEKQVFHKFWIERASDFNRVIAHLEKHGVDCDNQPLEDAIKAAKGTEVLAYLELDNFKTRAGEEVTDNKASNFTPVEG